MLALALLLLTGPSTTIVSGDRAIDLVQSAVQSIDRSRTSQCLAYAVEERSARRYVIAVREKHEGDCGGAPAVSPVIERFRVDLSPLSIARWNPVEDSYHPCRLSGREVVRCPVFDFERR